MKIEAHNAIFVLLLIVLQANVNCLSIESGMDWGFSIGDAFWFTMDYTGDFEDMIDQECYIQVNRLPESLYFTDSLVDFGLGLWDVTVYYYDGGTYLEMDWMLWYVIQLSYHRATTLGAISGWSLYTPVAFPLGNLSGLAILAAEYYGQDHVVILESDDYWGYELTCNKFYNNPDIYPNWNVTVQAHFDYSKNDGFLAHYHGLTTYADTGDIFQEISLDRNGLDRQIMTPVSFFSNTTPVTDFSNTTPFSQVSNTTTVSLYYEPLAQGMYMIAGLVWAIVIIFIVYDYKKRVSKIG